MIIKSWLLENGSKLSDKLIANRHIIFEGKNRMYNCVYLISLL